MCWTGFEAAQNPQTLMMIFIVKNQNELKNNKTTRVKVKLSLLNSMVVMKIWYITKCEMEVQRIVEN